MFPLKISRVIFANFFEPLWKQTGLCSVLDLNSQNPLRPVGIANKLLAASIALVSFSERPICCICEQCTLHKYLFYVSSLICLSIACELMKFFGLYQVEIGNQETLLFPTQDFFITFKLFHILFQEVLWVLFV